MRVNKAILIGYLGDDVKLHHFKNNKCIGRFPLVTNETYTNRQTGEKVAITEWHNIVVRNKTAEVCKKYLTKGDCIYAEGNIKTRKWQDDSGTPRYSIEIHLTEFKFLITKNNNRQQPQLVDQSGKTYNKEKYNDDLPF